MNFLHIKRIRVVVSLLFFFLSSLIFLNINEWFTSNLSEFITYLQFAPSFIKFFTISGISALGFLIITVITFLFGRIYCTTICPLGTLQDIISYLSRKILRKKKFFLLKSYSIVRYSIFAVTIIFLASGSIFLLNLLDPFSIFGKIIVHIFRPLILGLNNFLAKIFELFDIYWFYPADIKNVEWFSVYWGAFFLLIITLLASLRGRFYCNLICPIGTLLGIFSKFSIFQISIDESNCKSCNLCERECKAGCIDKKNKIIDFSRCVSCFNCFNACHSEGIVYKNSLSQDNPNDNIKNDENRRIFIHSIGVYLMGLFGAALGQVKIVPQKESKIPVLKKSPVSPPGSLSIEHFTSSCTACHLCISACPTQVLQPAFLEYGFLGIMQPRMDYITSFCNYECVICSNVCPTGAIKQINLADKKLSQIGKAVFIKDNCIVYTEDTACGACSEHCPTKAVDMIEPYKNLKAPKLNNDICIGCGACEFACPTKPYKAIYVEGNNIHEVAQKPKSEKIEQKINSGDDFPF